ncbi:3-hydroxyisobutyryl-CoA hydrolase [Kaistia sp. 32K]|uniref:enoyl-CoA hydratase/isomerase family protein n=1 Tax=Kaistia sp. 32K TaxID=2795690 RepID=UPI001915C41B|nr:enoyl-CoA hydratase/isomerase family protein [Kaistia sp. 32K]BCP53346.1 3-hydroxyisobutyryl-CoA hydrolase [Kaistia sp. 32K]
MAPPEIRFDREGYAGIVTLCRPGALNALSHGMVRALAEALASWKEDAGVQTVVIRAEGRAFCAGGDIRAVYEAGRGASEQRAFFRDEYRLNAAIKAFPKPYVALVDGYIMGGGAGIAVHGSHRAFAENAVFAMPETGIGFFPDVGSSYFLSRMPGAAGVYSALAAMRLRRGDALHAGIATHAVPAAAFDAIVQRLARGEGADIVLADHAEPVEAETLERLGPILDASFANGSVESILVGLDALNGPHADWARQTAATIRSKSPTSLRVALRQIRAARELDFDDCIRLDWRIACAILDGPDFYEGVRAALVDKDQSPAWQPATLSEVDPEAIDRHFVTPAEGDIPLP